MDSLRIGLTRLDLKIAADMLDCSVGFAHHWLGFLGS